MKALEILEDIKVFIFVDHSVWAGYKRRDFSEAISELEALQQHIKELESFEERSCMRCKNVNNCSLCENVKDDTGMKLREMSFFCFQKRD